MGDERDPLFDRERRTAGGLDAHERVVGGDVAARPSGVGVAQQVRVAGGQRDRLDRRERRELVGREHRQHARLPAAAHERDRVGARHERAAHDEHEAEATQREITVAVKLRRRLTQPLQPPRELPPAQPRCRRVAAVEQRRELTVELRAGRVGGEGSPRNGVLLAAGRSPCTNGLLQSPILRHVVLANRSDPTHRDLDRVTARRTFRDGVPCSSSPPGRGPVAARRTRRERRRADENSDVTPARNDPGIPTPGSLATWCGVSLSSA